MATEAGPRGAIPAEEARALAGRRGETVEEVMLGRLEQASGYA